MASQLFSSWRFYFTAGQPDSPIVGASDIGHEYTGLKQATGPRNRTRDLQNAQAVKSGVRTRDLQQHRVHESHEKYMDSAQIAHEKYTNRAWIAHVNYNRSRTKNTDCAQLPRGTCPADNGRRPDRSNFPNTQKGCISGYT